MLLRTCELLRALAARYSLRHVERALHPAYEAVYAELLFAPLLARDAAYVDALLAPYVADDGGLELLRASSHTLRSLSSFELVVAGDLGDRGPRLDRVIEALRRQFQVSIVWGNHDAEWMGACLGQEALIATVLRISLRYGRVSQLEEGYGIPVEPLELLARKAYPDDPAERFQPKGQDLRDPLLLARMQKAVAVLQFKLEGQTTRRNPEFDLEHRNLLHRIDPVAKTVTIDGAAHPLLDAHFPTVDFANPYELTADEAACLEHLKRSFLSSSLLWRDMRFVAEHGGMLAIRDEHVIFHGCVPVDAGGSPLELEVDGEARRGRALFDACDRVVRRAFRERRQKDLDLLYYLWAGPRSPLFGKDKMATFESYFVADKKTHKETKNAYFSLIHDAAFCRTIAAELGVEPSREPLIVNGHVPVKLEEGADIVPEIQTLRAYDPPRRVGDSQKGEELRAEIEGLAELVRAYRDHAIEAPPS
jgi:fructose-1,6-bisphosphatase-3